MEFPRLVYKSASTHVLAENEEAFNMFIRDGWFPTVPEALAGKSAVVEKPAQITDPKDDEKLSNAAPTRKELKQKADELGLIYPGNASNEKLASLIEEALAGKSE